MKKRNLLKALLAASVLCAVTAFAAEGTGVKGNPNSKVYHTSQCRHYTAKNTTKEFASAAKATEAGYKACKQCSGKKKSETKK